MAVNRLLNIVFRVAPRDAAREAGLAQPSREAGPPAAGVITASQSTITFAGAPAAVTVVWKVLSLAAPSLAGCTWLAIALSLIVGMIVYWQTAPVGGGPKDKAIGFLFALINSFAIAAAVLGIDTAIRSGTGVAPPT